MKSKEYTSVNIEETLIAYHAKIECSCACSKNY